MKVKSNMYLLVIATKVYTFGPVDVKLDLVYPMAVRRHYPITGSLLKICMLYATV